MNKQIPPAGPVSDGHRMPSAETAEARPGAFAVSPATGPLPATYVSPPSGQATAPSLVWHAAVRAVGWAVRHLPRHGPDRPLAADFADQDGNTGMLQEICYRPDPHPPIGTADEADDVAGNG
jgi:hypothetical protein